MASTQIQAPAQDPLIHTLFSCKASFNVAPPPPRKATNNRPNNGFGEVPKNTEGLRILASEGSWIDLLDLAQNLERELVRANQLNTANAAQMQRQNYIDGAVLQLILTRVTAYAKMNDFGRAVQVLQSVPFDKIPENEIPFSLSFLRVFLPMLLPTSSPVQIAAGQSHLYGMLSKVEVELLAIIKNEQEQQQQATQKPAVKNPHDPIALLEHRRFRIARALFVGHLRSQETVIATTLLQTIARFHQERRDRLVLFLNHNNNREQQKQQETAETFSENIFSTSSVVSRSSPDFSSSQKLSLKSIDLLNRSIETAEMEAILSLQQALCLSLYSGNAPLAHSIRKTIETFELTFEKKISSASAPTKREQDSSSSSTSTSSSSSSSDNDDDEDKIELLPPRKKSESRHLKELVRCLNDSLVDVFFDRPSDAASRLCNVVGTFLLDPSRNVLPPELATLGKFGKKIADPASTSSSTPAPSSNLNDTIRTFYGIAEEKSSTESSMILPFYLEHSRAIHVQHQFISICLTVVGLLPHFIHTPPVSNSSRTPAFVESKRPQASPETTALCNAALDRLSTAFPHLVLRMPAFHILVAQIRNSMAEQHSVARKAVYQSVLSYLVAGRESVTNLC